MKNKVIQRVESYLKRHRWKKALNRALTCFAAIAVFCTTYALILPAITMVTEPTCGYTEHTHGPECYASEGSVVLACSSDLHEHTSSCYEDGEVVCGFAEFVVHNHGDNCYDASGDLICNLPEISEHEHDDDCYITVEATLDSEDENEDEVIEETTEEEIEEVEYIEPHTHTDECYEIIEGELICTEEEIEGHTHSDECYDVVGETLVCDSEDEEHEHDDGCYEEETDLVCGEEEAEGHTHTDECYEEDEKELICDLEETDGTVEEIEEEVEEEIIEETIEEIETEPETELVLDCGHEEIILHKHTNSCYNSNGEVVCGKIQILEHIHGEDCMAEEGALICGLEEHTHNEVLCYISEEERELALRQGETVDFGMEASGEEETEAPTEVEELLSSVNIAMSVDDSGEVPVIVLSAQFDGISWPDYEWQWQISPDGELDWTDIEGATDTSYTISITEESLASYYRVYGIERDTESLLTRNMVYLVAEEEAEEEGLNSIEVLEDGSQNPSIMSDGVTPSSEYDMSLLAEGEYSINFCNYEGQSTDDDGYDDSVGRHILHTELVSDGSYVTKFDALPDIVGINWDEKWYLDENCTIEFNFTEPFSPSDYSNYIQDSSLYLYPGVQERWTAVFITNGEQIPAITMSSTETFDISNKVPLRAGYEFQGWYYDEYYTQPVTEDIQSKPDDLGAETNYTVYYYAKWEEKYVPFDALLAVENADDNGFSIADTLGTWYAVAGSTITVDTFDIEHRVYCELNGLKYPVYMSDPGSMDNENDAVQATLPDVYQDYYLFNNADTDAWKSVFKNGEMPWTERPVSTSVNRTIIVFDYMRVRVNVTYVMKNKLVDVNDIQQAMYFDIEALKDGFLSDHEVTGPVTVDGNPDFEKYTGVSPDGIEWEYTGAVDENVDGENIYVYKNVKYGQNITSVYPIGSVWVTSRDPGRTYSGWNPDEQIEDGYLKENDQLSLLAEVTPGMIVLSGRSAIGRTYRCEIENVHNFAAMYAFETLPGEIGDFSVVDPETGSTIAYKVNPYYNEILSSSGNLNQKGIYGFVEYSAQRYGLIRTEKTITIGALPESTATDGMSSFSLMRVLSSEAVAASAEEESIYTQYIVEDFDGDDVGSIVSESEANSYVSAPSVGLFEIYSRQTYDNLQSIQTDIGYDGTDALFFDAIGNSNTARETGIITKNVPLTYGDGTTNHVLLSYKLRFDLLPTAAASSNPWLNIAPVVTANGGYPYGTSSSPVHIMSGNKIGSNAIQTDKWYSIWVDVYQISDTQRNADVKIYDESGALIHTATKTYDQSGDMRIYPVFMANQAAGRRSNVQLTVDDAILREYIPEGETVRLDTEHTSVKEGEKYVDKDSSFDIVLDRPIETIPTTDNVIFYRADDETKTPIEITISGFDGASFKVDPTITLDEATWYVLDVSALTGDTTHTIQFRTDGTFYTSAIEDFDGDDVGSVTGGSNGWSYSSDPSLGVLVKFGSSIYSNYQSVTSGVGYNGTSGLYFNADNSVTASTATYRPTAITTKGMTLTYGDGVSAYTNRVMLSYKLKFDELPTADNNWMWLSVVDTKNATSKWDNSSFDVSSDNKFRTNGETKSAVETGKWYTIKTEVYQTSEEQRQVNSYLLDENGNVVATRSFSQSATPQDELYIQPVYLVGSARTSTAKFVVDDVELVEFIPDETYPMLDIEKTTIKDGANFVEKGDSFDIYFSESITQPISGSGVKLYKKDDPSEVVDVTIDDFGLDRFKLVLSSDLEQGTEYVLDFSGITNSSGNPITGQSQISFMSQGTSLYSKIEDFDGADIGTLVQSGSRVSYVSDPSVGVLDEYRFHNDGEDTMQLVDGAGYGETGNALRLSQAVVSGYWHGTGIATPKLSLEYSEESERHIVLDYKIKFKQFSKSTTAKLDRFLNIGLTSANNAQTSGYDLLMGVQETESGTIQFGNYEASTASNGTVSHNIRNGQTINLDGWYNINVELYRTSEDVIRAEFELRTDDGVVLLSQAREIEKSGDFYIIPAALTVTGEANRVQSAIVDIDDISLTEYVLSGNSFVLDEEKTSIKDGDTDVLPNEYITLYFSQPISTPFYGKEVALYKEGDPTPIKAIVADVSKNSFIIKPVETYEPGATYTVDFSGVKNSEGTPLDTAYSQTSITFTVAESGTYIVYEYPEFEYTNDENEIPQLVDEETAYKLLTETYWEDYEEPLNRLGGLGVLYYSNSAMLHPASQLHDFNLFLYNRIRTNVTFDFRYEDEDGNNIVQRYEGMMYETPMSEYRYATDNGEPHTALNREGYSFIGWADENGNVYTDEDWDNMVLDGIEQEELVFLAVWEKKTENIILYYNDKNRYEAGFTDENGNDNFFEYHYFSEGEVAPYPTMDVYPTSWAWTNQSTGKETTFDWNTELYSTYGKKVESSENGETITYNVVEVYGIWEDNTVIVDYNINEEAGGNPNCTPTDTDRYKLNTTYVTVKELLSPPEGEDYNTEGLEFAGWMLTQNGTIYQPGDHVKTAWWPTMNFVAVWTESPVTLTYHSNYPDSENKDPQTYNEDNSYAINSNVALWNNTTLVDGVEEDYFSCEFYRFVGWNTEPDGSGTAYMPNEVLTLTENTDLYAQWETYPYSLMINKYFLAGETESPLSGARFVIKDSAGNLVGSATTNIEGIVYVQNLKVGEKYELIEDRAPNGFNLLTDTVRFSAEDPGVVTYYDDNWEPLDENPYNFAEIEVRSETSRILSIKIRNDFTYVLPETGGIGIYPFIKGGIALMVVSAALLILISYVDKRKRS